MSHRNSSSRINAMASPPLLDEVKNTAENIPLNPRRRDSVAPLHRRESQANLSLTSPSSLSLMTCHRERSTESRNSSSSRFRDMLAESDRRIAADLNNSGRNSPIPIVSPSDDSEGSDPLEALGGFYHGEVHPALQDEIDKQYTHSRSSRRKSSRQHTSAWATTPHSPLARAVSTDSVSSHDSKTNRYSAVKDSTSPHRGSRDNPRKDALGNQSQPLHHENVQKEEKGHLTSPQDSPLSLSLVRDASQNRGVEDGGQEEKRIPHSASHRFNDSHHHGRTHRGNGRSRHFWHSDHRSHMEPSVGSAFFLAWDGGQKRRWCDPGSPARDEEFVNDAALTLVLLEPPVVPEDEEDEDDGGTLKGDGGFSHLIHTADASYMAYIEFIKQQRQIEKDKSRQTKKDEHEWQVLRYLNNVVSDIRKTSKEWTMTRILWIIFLLLLLTVGNFLQIIMLNFWLVSFPPEVKGNNYVVFALPGILFFLFFFSLQIVHLIRFRPSMSFAKNFSGQFLLFGVGFMDAVNSWMAAYAASFTSEVLQALFMNLSPVFAVFMSKIILRDDRRYFNRWVITVFFLTIAGVLFVTIYSFVTSPNVGKIVWILIYFASIPLRVLMNVWQSLYMIVYTYDSTFNEWLERKYVEEVVENAIRLQQGYSALSKKKMRRRRKTLVRKRRVRLAGDKVENGKGIQQQGGINASKRILPGNYTSERQDGKEISGCFSGTFSPTGVHGVSNTFSASTAVPPFAMTARGSIDRFSGVFSSHFPVDVHPQCSFPVEDSQNMNSEVFQSDEMQSTHIARSPRHPGESVLQSPNYFAPKMASTHRRTRPSRRVDHKTTEEHHGDLSIPIPTNDFPSPSDAACRAVASHSPIDTGKNEFAAENAQQGAFTRCLESEKTESGQFLLSDDDQNNGSSSDEEYTYYYVDECEGGDEGSSPRGEGLWGLKDESNEVYYRELDPEEVLQVLRSGAGEIILKGKEREILLEVSKSSGNGKDSDDLRYIMGTDPTESHSMPLTQQRRNIGIGTGMNLGSRRKARGYNPEFHFSPYQEHYRSLQSREGDDLSVKVHMLFGDTFWQLIISLALLPADALPWFGRSHSVRATWGNFCEGVTYVFTRKEPALYGIVYTLGFLFNYVGAAYLNHYSVALCSMVTQLSSPITALILVIIPSWDKNSDGTPPWYLSLLSIIFLSIAAFFYVLWEEKTDNEKKEAEMQLKRYKLNL